MMQSFYNTFEKLIDFINIKKDCIFCHTPLNAQITNFISINMDGFPSICAPLKDNCFKIELSHTTAQLSFKADITIYPFTNTVYIDNIVNEENSEVNNNTVKSVFDEYRPTVELYCPNKLCKTNYYLNSFPFTMIRMNTDKIYQILPCKIFLESFKIGHLNVINNFSIRETHIYSSKSDDIDPLRVPMMNFESMSKEKLFNRIHTLVNFS